MDQGKLFSFLLMGSALSIFFPISVNGQRGDLELDKVIDETDKFRCPVIFHDNIKEGRVPRVIREIICHPNIKPSGDCSQFTAPVMVYYPQSDTTKTIFVKVGCYSYMVNTEVDEKNP